MQTENRDSAMNTYASINKRESQNTGMGPPWDIKQSASHPSTNLNEHMKVKGVSKHPNLPKLSVPINAPDLPLYIRERLLIKDLTKQICLVKYV